MKMKLFVLMSACATLQAQSETAFTNNVPVGDYVIRLIVCDNFLDATNVQIMASERQISADRPFFLVLSNPSTNDTSILHPRESPLAFELRSADGALISKTPKGESMSRQPSSLTSLRTAMRSGPVPGGIQGRDFPKLTELFNFPSNGTYTFELRHWMWDKPEKKYILSDPVRLKVVEHEIKEEKTNAKEH